MLRTLAAVAGLSLTVGCAVTSAPHATKAEASTRPVSPTGDPAPAVLRPREQRSPHPATVHFTWSSRIPSAASLGRSWHPGCPVAPAHLRALRLTYWGFDHRAHTGTLVVGATVARGVAGVFRRLFRARFAIRRMVPVAAYGGSDDRSIRADNTSGFNCRVAVADGPPQWSMHAYGEAIDINPVENPYVLDGRVLPRSGAPYVDRGRQRRGMIVPGGPALAAFTGLGWGWGGAWAATPDYQHFSTNGR